MENMDECPIGKKPCQNLKKIEHVDPKTGESSYICESCCPMAHNSLSPPSITQLIHLIDDLFKKRLLARCQHCGLTAEELMRRARFGCPSCYRTFREAAMKYFDRCQEGVRHTGKRPSSTDVYDCDKEAMVDALREKMKRAVAVENYEIASVLKKKIEQLIQAKDTNAL